MKTIISNTIATTFALSVSALFVWLNVLGSQWSGVDVALGSCLSMLPVGFFLFAAIRNGVRFTLLWGLLVFALTFLSFLLYGMDAGLMSFLLVGVAGTAFIVAISVSALAYRPQDGALGALVRSGGSMASGMIQRVTNNNGSNNGKAGGISLMSVAVVFLLSANLFVSVLGVMV